MRSESEKMIRAFFIGFDSFHYFVFYFSFFVLVEMTQPSRLSSKTSAKVKGERNLWTALSSKKKLTLAIFFEDPQDLSSENSDESWKRALRKASTLLGKKFHQEFPIDSHVKAEVLASTLLSKLKREKKLNFLERRTLSVYRMVDDGNSLKDSIFQL